ncbi:hypothetical protein SPRG_06880 [Saprolegnia parasitica CBS 223.65]|uniref:Uncharacterized protein n=1 Tax=Saprolegnia parasitica (strain CBS 223.65) TaxID=695850 RepID=A0A067CLD3_SAPPC|nr:hypothetical protein SPRG_06880 [Saprolegnia parasitica CBS 223.65]KDO27612.1 hypothetical protein SPRG_06880 [Saprolegnia parasitica CBS 223.65]|eukprot:XP_012201734.1 hypothetical protein SPRG_06880 [Saprolegnia parasitica CBS 223.65]
MVDQLLLDCAPSAHFALGLQTMDNMSQTTIFVHEYNALRIAGRMAAIPAPDAVSDLYTRRSRIWIGSARGCVATARGLSLGLTRTQASTWSDLMTPNAKVAKQQYHDRKLQKAHGVATGGAVPRTMMTTALSRSVRLFSLLLRKPTDLGDLRRTLDAEWHRFLHLDLVHVGNVLGDVRTSLERRVDAIEPTRTAKAVVMILLRSLDANADDITD